MNYILDIRPVLRGSVIAQVCPGSTAVKSWIAFVGASVAVRRAAAMLVVSLRRMAVVTMLPMVGCGAGSGSAGIFAEGDVTDPVDRVLYPPVVSDGSGQGGEVGLIGGVVADAGGVGDVELAFFGADVAAVLTDGAGGCGNRDAGVRGGGEWVRTALAGSVKLLPTLSERHQDSVTFGFEALPRWTHRTAPSCHLALDPRSPNTRT